MKVLKFGGTSVGSVEALNQVLNIIQKNLINDEKIVVVCSAMAGVTNSLIEAGRLAAVADSKHKQLITDIEEKHLEIISLIISNNTQEIIGEIKELIKELEHILTGVFLLGELSPRTQDLIAGFGELLSCKVIAKYLQQYNINAKFSDSRQLIKTNNNFGNAQVDFEATNKALHQFYKHLDYIPIITGFIASTIDNKTTTLGRGGSDYTASIIGAGINANAIEIWTDVNGVMTADPKLVKKAFTVSNISYLEAIELSHFGAKIIYSPTLYPAFSKLIPLWVKNTFNPTHMGTLVSEHSIANGHLIKGISSINSVAVLTIQGQSMVGLPGFLGRMFNAIAQKNINVILATQGSSEYSICVVVASENGIDAANAVNQEFEHEIRLAKVDKVSAKNNFSVISIIGEGMRRHSGLAGKFFSALGKNGINIISIAQGASELNISAVIETKELQKALNVIHEAFFDEDLHYINVFMVGTGLIGGTLLKQIQQTSQYLLKEKNLKINIVSLANSKKMLFSEPEIDLCTWREALTNSEYSISLAKLIAKMKKLNLPNTVFIDCTCNRDVVNHYSSILEANISIVTPNKIANSGIYEDYLKLKHIVRNHGGKFMYETNVGAGLPVINTLQNLKLSGDTILKIEGVLSGTLSYIFNNFTGSSRFSEVVRKAKELGYTEPDPRDDLNGTDVARKILILAREAESQLELSEVTRQSILPQSCIEAKNITEFFSELEKHDDIFEAQKQQAALEGKVLRFIAKYENGVASIGLTMVDSSHPFYALSGGDNIISFTTERYKERPLVIQGPGAGAEVTASGLFAEVIAISSYLKS
ncbi:MAG: bifunctional aspartate kinase/homoserine dehydrogenase I [Burkholderiales bacterium]|nr:bifunctional aspartate kinase/homoserine dehydrogenase I [Burkholderiales bacterium]